MLSAQTFLMTRNPGAQSIEKKKTGKSSVRLVSSPIF